MKLKPSISKKIHMDGKVYQNTKIPSHNFWEEQLNEIENMFVPINEVFNPEI